MLVQNQMKEKENKIRLVKQILVNDDVDPVTIISQKEHTESTAKVFSDTETRTSRKVTCHLFMFSFEI